MDLATKQRKVIRRGGSFPRYAATGHLVYVREATMFAAPFDPVMLESEPHEEADAAHVWLLLNWVAELERRVAG